jgi:hypothetical protein
MKYLKTKRCKVLTQEEKGRLLYCTIIGREGDGNNSLFYQRDDGTMVVNLVGYTILPSEQYEHLKVLAGKQ